MEKLTLKRLHTDEDGTFGELWRGDEMLCVTCEDPDLENQTGISCIPIDTYHCISHNTQKYPDVWEVAGVPGREAILIHNGNTEDDTRGCILVGSEFGEVNGKPGVLHSKPTLEKLKLTLPREFDLEIIWENAAG